MTTKTTQPRIPYGLSLGDRVVWLHGIDEPVENGGIIIDFLSTQVLVEDDDYNVYVVPFKDIRPANKGIPPSE